MVSLEQQRKGGALNGREKLTKAIEVLEAARMHYFDTGIDGEMEQYFIEGIAWFKMARAMAFDGATLPEWWRNLPE